MGWKREIYEMPEDHGWTARPGHKILVLEAGAVLLEYPRDWVVEPTSHEIAIRDAEAHEGSSCVLAVSFLRLPPRDWSDLPLPGLLREACKGDAPVGFGA